eukprot:3714766-Prymnesium_polylepis.1
MTGEPIRIEGCTLAIAADGNVGLVHPELSAFQMEVRMLRNVERDNRTRVEQRCANVGDGGHSDNTVR